MEIVASPFSLSCVIVLRRKFFISFSFEKLRSPEATALAVSGGLELLIPTARLAAPVDVTLLAVSGASSSLLLPGLGSMNFKNEFLCV